MNSVFYFSDPTKLTHLVRWLDINTINTLEQAANTESTLVFWEYFESQIGAEELAVIAHRRDRGLLTKVIFDRSYEDCSSVILFRNIAERYQQLGFDPAEDLHFILNTSIRIDPAIDQFVQEYNTTIVDYFAIDAVKRVEQNPSLASTIPLTERPNAINLLVSKLRSRHTRFRALYEFWRQGLLNPETITGILADRQDMSYHVTLYPEVYHRDFWWAVVPRLDSPDQTVTSFNITDGHTSNTGWGQDSSIYDRTRISYVCETVDIMTGGHGGRNHLLITEKTYRSIINGTALIVQGAPGFLSNLQALGFRTWSNLIDESYNEHQSTDWSHVAPAVAAAAQLKYALESRADAAEATAQWNRAVLRDRGHKHLDRANRQIAAWLVNVQAQVL